MHAKTWQDNELVKELFEQRARKLEQKQANRQRGKRTRKQNKRAKVRDDSAALTCHQKQTIVLTLASLLLVVEEMNSVWPGPIYSKAEPPAG